MHFFPFFVSRVGSYPLIAHGFSSPDMKWTIHVVNAHDFSSFTIYDFTAESEINYITAMTSGMEGSRLRSRMVWYEMARRFSE